MLCKFCSFILTRQLCSKRIVVLLRVAVRWYWSYRSWRHETSRSANVFRNVIVCSWRLQENVNQSQCIWLTAQASPDDKQSPIPDSQAIHCPVDFNWTLRSIKGIHHASTHLFRMFLRMLLQQSAHTCSYLKVIKFTFRKYLRDSPSKEVKIKVTEVWAWSPIKT